MFNYQGATRSQIWTFLVSLTSLSILALLLSPSIGPSRYGSEPQLGMPSIIAPPYTAVILYLVTLSRVSELLDSLASINTNLPGPPWPIVLFHTGDFDGEHQRLEFIAQVRSHIGQENGSFQFAERIEFARLDWRLPEDISTDKDIVDPVDAHRWPGESSATYYLLQLAESVYTCRLSPHVCLLCYRNIFHSALERCDILHAHGH